MKCRSIISMVAVHLIFGLCLSQAEDVKSTPDVAASQISPLEKARADLALASAKYTTLNIERAEVAKELRSVTMEILPNKIEDGEGDGGEVQKLRKRLAEVERERKQIREEIKELLEANPEYQARQTKREQTYMRRAEIEKERHELSLQIRSLTVAVRELEQKESAENALKLAEENASGQGDVVQP